MSKDKKINIEETFYTAEEVAKLLGSNKKVIEKKLRETELRGSKRLGKWFVLSSDLIEYAVAFATTQILTYRN